MTNHTQTATGEGNAPRELSENERLSIRLAAWSKILSVKRLASEPESITRDDLYSINKLMREIASGLADESRKLKA